MVIFSIIIIFAAVLVFLYDRNKIKDDDVGQVIHELENMSDTEYAESVREKQAFLKKIKIKNIATKEAFMYYEKGLFIQLNPDSGNPRYLNMSENKHYTEEFHNQPRYVVAGTYNNEYYIIYLDETPYVSLSLLQTLYLFDESMWRKVLYPVEFIDGLGYNFLEFLKLSLPQRNPDNKWLDETSSETINRFYFKDLTAAEILSVPAGFRY